ncbi:MAG: hypothetical protein A2527_09590 [Candidatus Lambdaproteobacteria bacterium RIFOXYD2_FULL_50_16]|uniref:Uncharacterized protein n=1 Tax=Candidatus Lambdaproteobacteria bacterium RIFOXYD2_FULL_50_16 TaxID=1817772 RepID=A0A1F6G7L5_9PROT|nr:MAG: hypothetical protein A2527_09590 [Candidatus Lambdaproteobacteria bacterium RIFOXYD2_FULL_50_16]
MALDIQAVANDMLAMVTEAAGKKRYKPGDLIKAMLDKYESEGIDKKDCKAAIKELVDAERVTYTYFNGTWLELPHQEGSAKA